MITVFMTKTSDAKNKRKTIKNAFFGSVKKMVFVFEFGVQKIFFHYGSIFCNFSLKHGIIDKNR
jgi:hypothetical protein